MSDTSKLDQAWATYAAEAKRTNSLVLLRHAFDAGAMAMADIMRNRAIDNAPTEPSPPSCPPTVCDWTAQISCTRCERVTRQYCHSPTNGEAYRECSECGHKSQL